MDSFRGWPADALAFYAGLEADNSRSYWQAHKSTYDESVKAPFAALSEVVAKEFGALRLFRPHRDTRFSKDKTPYKTAQGAVAEGRGGTMYYVAFSAVGLYAGSGYYMFAPDQLERWRKAVADGKSGPALERALKHVLAKKYEAASRDALKSAPRGYDKDHPRIELLRRKGLHVGREFGAPKWIHTKAAADRIVQVWRDAAPVDKWLDKYVGPSEEAPPEPE